MTACSLKTLKFVAICYSSKREANRSAEKTELRGQISVNSFPCGTNRLYLPLYCQVILLSCMKCPQPV